MIHKHEDTLKHHDHRTGVVFECGRCHKVVSREPVVGGGSVGYGYDNRYGEGRLPICFDCCGEIDIEDMEAEGRTILYLNCPERRKMVHGSMGGVLSNWPGTYKVPCRVRVGRHNIAGVRYDVSFIGPDGKNWYGTQYGNNTQICRCRRKK